MTDLFEDVQDLLDDSAFEDVTPVGETTYIKPAEWENNQKLQGVFLGTYQSWGPKDKPFDRPQANHRIMTKADGTIKVLSGCTSLDNYFAAIAPFSYVQVQFDGTRLIESGKNAGKNAFIFTVKAIAQGKETAPIKALVDKAKTLPAYEAPKDKPEPKKAVLAADDDTDNTPDI